MSRWDDTCVASFFSPEPSKDARGPHTLAQQLRASMELLLLRKQCSYYALKHSPYHLALTSSCAEPSRPGELPVLRLGRIKFLFSLSAKEIQTQPQPNNPETPVSTSPSPMLPANEQIRPSPLQMAMSVGLGLAAMQDDNGNRIISLLSFENQSLKNELEVCRAKVSALMVILSTSNILLGYSSNRVHERRFQTIGSRASPSVLPDPSRGAAGG